MYLSTILIALVAAVSQAAPIQDLPCPKTRLSHDEIQHFLQARDHFMFDRKQDYQDIPLRVQTRHTKRDADCSTFPPELEDYCYLIYGYEEDLSDTPLDYNNDVIVVDDLRSSQSGWNA